MNGNQTPKRLRHAIVLALGLGISNVALSLGLGPIDVKSYLGQPMFATIRVDGLNASTAKAMTVKLASPAAYKSRGIEMLPDHQQMRFALVPSGKGYVIRITSLGSIKEPFINFLLTISGNGNVVTREYAAFFNPDPAMEAGIGKSATVARTSAPSPAAAVKKVKPQPASSASTGWGAGRQAVKPEVKSHAAVNPRTKSTYSTPDSIPVGSSYGPIRPGETLYSIAKAARPSEAISVHDMMRMIFNANRQAFSRGNMSNLMAGATLYIPVPGKANASSANTNTKAPARPSTSTAGKKKNERSENNSARATEEAPPVVSDTQNNDVDNEKAADDVISQTPGSAAAQLVFGSENDNESATTADTSEAAANENTVLPVSVEDEPVTPVEENNHLTLDTPESIETAQSADETTTGENISTETELPPPVVDMPQTDDNTIIAAPVETTPEPVITEQPVTPTVAVEENIKSVPGPSVSSPPPVAEEKSFFSLPIPLLAGGLAGILALGGLALFFWRKRKNSNKDSVEEFSQEDIDRMVAEMEAEHEKGDLDFDALSAVIDKDNSAKTQTTDQGFSDTPPAENFGLTDDELPDDFFKDMELSEEEDTDKQGYETSTTPVENLSLDKSEANAEPAQYSEDDFFADLEFNQSGNSATASSADTTDVDMNFLTDLSADLEEKDAASSKTSSAQSTDKAHSTDIDFSADSDDDSFFADAPLSSDKAKENTDGEDLDFFVEDMPSAAEEKAQTSESNAAGEELDFFLDEFPEDTKAETAEKEAETPEDNLDFFMDDDSPAQATATDSEDDDATGVDFFIDEDTSPASTDSALQHDVSNKADDASVDFFSEEETEADTSPESKTSARHSDDVPNDIQNLFDDEDSALDSIPAPAAEKPASKPAPVIDTEAMEINLDMATSFIAMGKNEKARSWLEEVLEVGTEEQKERAKAMLAQINKG